MSDRRAAVGKLEGDCEFRWWCPGCGLSHIVPTKPLDPNGWDFNEDYANPTLSPSVLVHSHKTLIRHDLELDALTAPEDIGTAPRCHCFIRNGRIQFLDDCEHALAGQTVPMVVLFPKH